MSKVDRYVGDDQLFWLRSELMRLRLPQRQVAKVMEIDPASLNRSLKGRRRLSIEEFEKAAAYVEANVDGFASRLGRLLHAKGMRFDKIAEATGIDRDRLAQLVSRPDARPTLAEARAFENHLGLPLAALLPEESRTLPVDRRTPLHADDDERIAVYAALQHLGDGWFSPLSHIVEHRPRPAQLRGVTSAFAVYVGEPFLAPRYEPGEVLFAHGGRPVTIGKWAIVENGDGQVALGRVLSISASELQLRSNEDLPAVVIGRRSVRRSATVVGTWFE